MGHWGVKLYENDISMDIKDQFEEMLRKGKDVKAITTQLIETFSFLKDDCYEESLFWFALADTQWNFGVLLPYVKEQALIRIEKECFKEMLKSENCSKKLISKEVIDDLRLKLLSPQPSLKKPISKKFYRCEWNIGDVFAYQLESDLSMEKGLQNCYLLIQKVDEDIWYPGHVVPIVYVKLTKDNKLPTTVNEYNQLEYIQTSFSKYEERFWPIDGKRPQEDIAEKSKINYQVDEFGFLPQFRAILLNTSKKIIPSKLVYVGNFANPIRPKNEFVPHAKTNIMAISWKKHNETFETRMIKLYYGHNLREFEVYSKR